MAKTKALISFAVNAKLICVFVFTYTKIQFFYDKAHFDIIMPQVSILLVLSLKIVSVTQQKK